MPLPTLRAASPATGADVGAGSHAFVGTITIPSMTDGIVCVKLNNFAATTGVRLTDASGALFTQCGTRVVNSSTRNAELFYLLNPTPGTYPIYVESSHSVGAAVIECYDNVHQGTPFGTFVSGTFTSVDETLNAVSPEDGVVIDGVGCQFNDGTPTPAAGQTATESGVVGDAFMMNGSYKAAVGTVTMAWASAQDSAAFAVALNPAVAPVATQLVIVSAPTTGLSNVTLLDFVVAVQYPSGNVVTGDTGTVTASIATVGCTLSGTTAPSAVAGLATFSDLEIQGSGSIVMTFSRTGLTPCTVTLQVDVDSTLTGNSVVTCS